MGLKNIDKITMCFLVFFLPFQNIGFSSGGGNEFLGVIAYYFAIFAILIALLKLVSNHQIHRGMSLFVCFSVIISIVGFYQYGFYSHGEFLIVKAIKVALIWFVFLYIASLKTSEITESYICALWLGLIVMLIAFYLIDIFKVLPADSFLTAKHNLNMRPRGLAREASHFSFYIVSTGLLILSVNNRKILNPTLILVLLVSLYLCMSKGGGAVLVVSMIIVSLVSLKIKQSIPVVIMICMLGFIFYDQFMHLILTDLEKHTSIATRLVSFLTAIYMLSFNPMGAGLGAWLPAFVTGLPEVISILESFDLHLNYREVTTYIYQVDDSRITSKNTFSQTLLIWGVMGGGLYVYAHIKLYFHYAWNYWSRILVVFLFLSGLIYMSTYMFMGAAVAYMTLRNYKLRNSL